jgi:phosphatidylinositol-binding clathrin assembly protein
VSLAGALEEYLKDPNFEQNRLEYRANKLAADKNEGEAAAGPSSGADANVKASTSPNTSPKPPSKVSFAETKKPEKRKFIFLA